MQQVLMLCNRLGSAVQQVGTCGATGVLCDRCRCACYSHGIVADFQVVATTYVFTKNESDMKIKKRNIKHDTATRVLHCCYC